MKYTYRTIEFVCAVRWVNLLFVIYEDKNATVRVFIVKNLQVKPRASTTLIYSVQLALMIMAQLLCYDRVADKRPIGCSVLLGSKLQSMTARVYNRTLCGSNVQLCKMYDLLLCIVDY